MTDHEDEPSGLLTKVAKAIAPLVHHSLISNVLGLVAALAPLLYQLVGDGLDIPIGVIIGLVVFYFALNILTDRVMRTVIDLEMSVIGITIRLVGSTIAERLTAAKEVALSLTYLGKLKQRHSAIKSALLASAGALVILNFKFPALDLLDLAAVSVAALGLLVLKESIVEYRIRAGLFGTTRSEAKELIEFLLKNSDDIDFTDSNGNLRKALLPEDAGRHELKGQLTPGGATV